ncbi:unnamed protein product [Discosporangium mesarthrocarpum]
MKWFTAFIFMVKACWYAQAFQSSPRGHRPFLASSPWSCQASLRDRACHAYRSNSLRMNDDSVGALLQATHVLAEAMGRGVSATDQIPYVPSDEVDNFSQIAAGSAACVLAYLWAAYEFGKRIVIQRRCAVCKGTGLVSVTKDGTKLTRPRKCYSCGGFLPWQSWGRFWEANMDVGNGGILQRPSEDYERLNQLAKDQEEGARGPIE